MNAATREPVTTDNIGEHLKRQDEARILHEFTVPKSLQVHGTTKVEMVELTVDEQIMASKSAAGDNFRTGIELVLLSLRGVDGKPISSVNGSNEIAFRRMHPKVRDLVASAYRLLHQSEAVEAKDFLESHVQKA